jgi:hypothetical protein
MGYPRPLRRRIALRWQMIRWDFFPLLLYRLTSFLRVSIVHLSTSIGELHEQRAPSISNLAQIKDRRKRMPIATQPFGRTGHISTRTIFGAASLSRVTQEEADRTHGP